MSASAGAMVCPHPAESAIHRLGFATRGAKAVSVDSTWLVADERAGGRTADERASDRAAAAQE